ncbi:MAG: hypothetical protein CMJ21_07135 [Phycisphaerae bacterium]|nr:hypothetical protein [Phycisphaerae bacterium]
MAPKYPCHLLQPRFPGFEKDIITQFDFRPMVHRTWNGNEPAGAGLLFSAPFRLANFAFLPDLPCNHKFAQKPNHLNETVHAVGLGRLDDIARCEM